MVTFEEVRNETLEQTMRRALSNAKRNEKWAATREARAYYKGVATGYSSALEMLLKAQP